MSVKQMMLYFKGKIITSLNPIADFTFEQPNACHIAIEYDFINTTPKSYFDELAETCSSPAIQWQISGNESVDWVIDSLTLDADTFEVTFEYWFL